MKDGLCDRYRHWRRRIDLDDAAIAMERLEVLAPESGRKTPRKMGVLFLQLVLRQTLTDGGVALNLFHDGEDDCLRGLEYFVEGEGKSTWREFYPAPGCFAEQVLRELRWRSGVHHAPGEGMLHYRRQGKALTALAIVPDSSEVRVYFTEDRPTMRNKGV